MKLALYEIANDYRDAVEKLSDMDLPPEAVQNTLEALQGELQIKATNVAAFCQNLESLAESIKLAESKMAHRRKVIENRVASIKHYIKTCMESAGITKIEMQDRPEFKLSIKKNPPSVEIVDSVIVPDKYLNYPVPPPPTLDKKRIADDLKQGIEVPGARLKQETRLNID